MEENLYVVGCAMIIEPIERNILSIEEMLAKTCFAEKIIKIESTTKAISYFEKIERREANVYVPDIVFISDAFPDLLEGLFSHIENKVFLAPKLIILSDKAIKREVIKYNKSTKVISNH